MRSRVISFGHCSLVIVHWSLFIGHWPLVIVHCSLFIALLLTCTGCGPLQPAPTVTPISSLPSPTPPLPTSMPTPTPQPESLLITLTLWVPEPLSPYGDRPGAAVLAQQLDDFNAAYPDIQVEVIVKQAHGRGGLLDFLRTARDAAPSVVPDLVVLDAAELETATAVGLIQPLDDLLSPSITASRFPFATTLGAVEEQTTGFVIAADMQHLAYRPALSESPPVSWTQVVSPPIPFLFPAGGLDRQVNDATLIQYLAAGGKVTDPDGNPWLDEEVMVSVLGFYSDCTSAAAISPTFDTPAISPTLVLDITDADQAWGRFQEGEGGMTVVRANRYWLEADETNETDEADETVAAAPIPTHDGQPFSIARGWAIAMVAGDPARQSLAMLLLDWLIAPNHSARWTQASGYLPGTRNALRLWSISSVDRATLRSVMEAAVPPPQPKALEIVGPAMQEALEAVLRGWDTPEEATAAAIKSLEE